MSGTTKTDFLLTGATGYIGGSILARFLAHPQADSFQFTVLVRDPKKAKKFEELGVKAVVGSHSDPELMEKLASEADVVIATADCDDLGAAKATLAGLKKRGATSGRIPIFMNTVIWHWYKYFLRTYLKIQLIGFPSGEISDNAKGMHSDITIYDDSDVDQIKSISPTQMHRDVDLAITAADAEGVWNKCLQGYVKTYIILPSTIYGLATGSFVDNGLQNPHSQQIPLLISSSLDRGRAGMVGQGKNVWSNVEIHEVADLYATLYDKIVSDPNTGHGWEGFYFAENDEASFYDICKTIGSALVALGKTDNPEPTTFSQAELDKYFRGSAFLGSNSRCRATRPRSIGWKPVKSTQDMLVQLTGYIGGSILARFLAHPHSDAFQFTVLVRDPKKAEKFKDLGAVKAVVGSHSDFPLLEKLASKADVVIAAVRNIIADCDDLGAAKATLAGLKKRHALGVVPIFINTSGTGVISDDARGMHSDVTIYDDSDVNQIQSIAPTQMHREVDLEIVAADSEGYVKTYIVLPSTIYGLATGPLVDLGIQNPHSQQIPLLISAALDRGRAGMVGEGKNLWPNVEIHELADLYATLYDQVVADASTGHGWNGFYFGANGEHSLYDVGKGIGSALVALGKTDNPEPTTFSQAELDKYFGGTAYLGSNSRCRATRSRSIGWKPVKSTDDMLGTIRAEMESLIEKKGSSA
ncbi:hypothetical protein R3P38DRAFT_3388776 [Favolaschia claudopus]|uniref:NAD(P)-binding domain-containing protein n=1 Tax=Favolaschia claudopus TaxID=2862362 RepID=A0AAW0CZR1_9AGAR